jgi:hypothetical protein
VDVQGLMKLKVARGAIGLGWKGTMALSVLLFRDGDERYKSVGFKAIAAKTGIETKTLKNMFTPKATTRRGPKGECLHALTQPTTGTPAMLIVTDLEGDNPTVRFNKEYPLDKTFRRGVHADRVFHYFWLAVPTRECPLTPADNYYYWWLRQRIAAETRLGKKGKKGLSDLKLETVVKWTNLPPATVERAMAELTRLKWIVRGPGKTYRVGPADLSAYYTPQVGKRTLWELGEVYTAEVGMEPLTEPLPTSVAHQPEESLPAAATVEALAQTLSAADLDDSPAPLRGERAVVLVTKFHADEEDDADVEDFMAELRQR